MTYVQCNTTENCKFFLTWKSPEWWQGADHSFAIAIMYLYSDTTPVQDLCSSLTSPTRAGIENYSFPEPPIQQEMLADTNWQFTSPGCPSSIKLRVSLSYSLLLLHSNWQVSFQMWLIMWILFPCRSASTLLHEIWMCWNNGNAVVVVVAGRQGLYESFQDAPSSMLH